ncbi:hypothetical protein OHU45_12290 [Streptomyces tubercidicus]|uniref:hypothetical protein n=1 Tax=Streptomyces tubercidicus TaxID=47759 RepID=UPI002E1527AE|nr:hypothetical protein OG761_12010 [Streptomyces tubercidicus]WSX22764.1 hypothetical protein OG690_25000 [Streptomyces tubercidicus]
MNIIGTGTIDRPVTRDPQKQDLTMNPTFTDTPVPVNTDAIESRQNRNHAMQLIPEALARAHMHERLREAESERRAHRLAAARRMQRRAERASLRARRALAMAVMQ